MAHRLENIAFENVTTVGFNRTAYKNTIRHFSGDHSDMFSKTDAERLLQANDFIAIKAFGMLMNRNRSFRYRYFIEFFNAIFRKEYKTRFFDFTIHHN